MSFQTYARDPDLIQREWENDKKQQSDDNSSTGGIFHYLKSGRTKLRVMPPYKQGVFFRGYNQYSFWNEKIHEASPADHGDPDPFLEHRKTLEKVGTEEALQEAARFKPRAQYLFNVIILEDPEGASPKDGVKILQTGVMVKRAIIDLDHDEDEWGDITDLEKGYNITIDKEGSGRETTYTVKGVHKGERNIVKLLAEDFDIDINTLTLHDLDAVSTPKNYDTLKQIVESLKKAPTPVASAPGPKMPSIPSPVMVAENESAGIPVVPAPPTVEE